MFVGFSAEFQTTPDTRIHRALSREVSVSRSRSSASSRIGSELDQNTALTSAKQTLLGWAHSQLRAGKVAPKGGNRGRAGNGGWLTLISTRASFLLMVRIFVCLGCPHRQCQP